MIQCNTTKGSYGRLASKTICHALLPFCQASGVYALTDGIGTLRLLSVTSETGMYLELDLLNSYAFCYNRKILSYTGTFQCIQHSCTHSKARKKIIQ